MMRNDTVQYETKLKYQDRSVLRDDGRNEGNEEERDEGCKKGRRMGSRLTLICYYIMTKREEERKKESKEERKKITRINWCIITITAIFSTCSITQMIRYDTI
jgi:hypothetical protein